MVKSTVSTSKVPNLEPLTGEEVDDYDKDQADCRLKNIVVMSLKGF